MILDVARFEARRSIYSIIVIVVAALLLAAANLIFYPSIRVEEQALSKMVESLPPELLNFFGKGLKIYTGIEAYLVLNYYLFVWVLILGMYYAYAGAGIVVNELESGTIDLLLANPLRRWEVIVGKYLSIVVSVVIINIALPLGVYVGVIALGETTSLQWILITHVASIAYHVLCISLGLLVAALLDPRQRPGLLAAGLVFALYTIDTLTYSTSKSWVGLISPTRHYNPTDTLVNHSVSIAGQLLLFTAAIIMLIVSMMLFEGRDL